RLSPYAPSTSTARAIPPRVKPPARAFINMPAAPTTSGSMPSIGSVIMLVITRIWNSTRTLAESRPLSAMGAMLAFHIARCRPRPGLDFGSCPTTESKMPNCWPASSSAVMISWTLSRSRSDIGHHLPPLDLARHVPRRLLKILDHVALLVSTPDVLDSVAEVEAHMLGDRDALHAGRMCGVMRRVIDKVGHVSSSPACTHEPCSPR